MPKLLLKFFGILLGRQKEIDRLIGSLKIDISYTKAVLNWSPPISVEEGIRRYYLPLIYLIVAPLFLNKSVLGIIKNYLY